MKPVNPFRLIIAGYVSIIILGVFLLLLPFSHRGHLTPIDALFTSTSAVCVTGLIVKDTSHFFTHFGKAVILVLIQIGGIGYMTLATLILFILKKKGSLAMRLTMAESFPELTLGGIFEFAKRVFILTVIFESVGAVLLTIGFKSAGFSTVNSIYHAVFHAVSAFCNAGFSSFRWSLSGFRGNTLINLTVITLFVSGGLGFVVWNDLYSRFISKRSKKLLLHTKVVLLSTFLLILVGFLFVFLLEYKNSMSGFSIKEKLLASLFQASTPRTAGFSTISIGSMHPATLFFIVLLMIVGGSPGGTAGGMKTTTIFAVFLWMRSYFLGREEPHAFKYRIPEESVRRAFSILFLGTITIILALTFILILEGANSISRGFLPHLFEVASAYGTVGLSMGSQKIAYLSLSRDFSTFGKGIIILTMLIGRVGVLTAAAFILGKKRERVGYIEGKFIVG